MSETTSGTTTTTAQYERGRRQEYIRSRHGDSSADVNYESRGDREDGGQFDVSALGTSARHPDVRI